MSGTNDGAWQNLLARVKLLEQERRTFNRDILRAQLAATIAAGMLAYPGADGEAEYTASHSLSIADAILARCGLGEG
jgi:hypothetical protein